MSNFYKHERDEKYIPAIEADRPPMPKPTPSLEPDVKKYLLSRKLSYTIARENGWYASREVDGYDRIVIPCSNSKGIPYWQARAIDDWTHIRYQSPRATRQDSVVLVWPRLNTPKLGSIVCEGPADALAAAMLGYVGIGLMGNVPPPEVVDYVVQFIKDSYEPAIVIPDLDHVEMGAFLTGSLAVNGIKVRTVLPPKKDLAGLKVWQREKLVA